MGFMEFMGEKKQVDRWFVMRVALIGAFAGALLTTMFIMFGVVRI
jgi:hypothetical protein